MKSKILITFIKILNVKQNGMDGVINIVLMSMLKKLFKVILIF